MHSILAPVFAILPCIVQGGFESHGEESISVQSLRGEHIRDVPQSAADLRNASPTSLGNKVSWKAAASSVNTIAPPTEATAGHVSSGASSHASPTSLGNEVTWVANDSSPKAAVPPTDDPKGHFSPGALEDPMEAIKDEKATVSENKTPENGMINSSDSIHSPSAAATHAAWHVPPVSKFDKHDHIIVAKGKHGVSEDSHLTERIDEEMEKIVSKRMTETNSVLSWLSELFGLLFVLAWVSSFIPQIVLNGRNKSVAGLSCDFVVLTLMGHACYLAYAAARFSVERESQLPKAVHIHEVVLSAWVLLATLVYAVQLCMYDRAGRGVGVWCKWAVLILTVVMATNAFLAFRGAIPWYVKHPVEWNLDPSIFAEAIKKITAGSSKPVTVADSRMLAVIGVHWVDMETWSFIQCLGFTKVVTGVIRFIPQISLNGQRRSTEGLSNCMVTLELVAALCMSAQSAIDTVNYRSLEFIAGPSSVSKMLINTLSSLFALLILFQALCVYRGCRPLEPYQPLKGLGDPTLGKPFEEARRMSVHVDVEGDAGEPSLSESEDEPSDEADHKDFKNVSVAVL